MLPLPHLLLRQPATRGRRRAPQARHHRRRCPRAASAVLAAMTVDGRTSLATSRGDTAEQVWHQAKLSPRRLCIPAGLRATTATATTGANGNSDVAGRFQGPDVMHSHPAHSPPEQSMVRCCCWSATTVIDAWKQKHVTMSIRAGRCCVAAHRLAIATAGGTPVCSRTCPTRPQSCS